MKIKELSVRADVPIPTIKYYLREGLLPKGEPLGETKADYGEDHLERLQVIRTLVEVGEVPIARIRGLLAAIDDETVPPAALLAAALDAATAEPRAARDEPGDRTGADDLIAARGWKSGTDGRDQLARSLADLRSRGLPADADRLAPYLEAADAIAAHQLPLLPPPTQRTEFAIQAVVRSVLFRHLLTALVRVATENA